MPLLLDGIGDTVRVSLTGSPLLEAAAARDILRAIGLRGGVELVSCPTCGRTPGGCGGLAKSVEESTRHIKANIKIAVMGCVVNGPGEAQDADIALCGGDDSSALYHKGKFVKKVEGDPTAAPAVVLIQTHLTRKGKADKHMTRDDLFNVIFKQLPELKDKNCSCSTSSMMRAGTGLFSFFMRMCWWKRLP